MGNNRAWSFTRVNLRNPAFYNLYPQPSSNNKYFSNTIIFADDTSVVIASENLDRFGRLANTVASYLSK
jgi:hypothetical protein